PGSAGGAAPGRRPRRPAGRDRDTAKGGGLEALARDRRASVVALVRRHARGRDPGLERDDRGAVVIEASPDFAYIVNRQQTPSDSREFLVWKEARLQSELSVFDEPCGSSGEAPAMQVLTSPPSGWPALVLNADFRPLSYYPLSLWPWQEV